MKIINTEVWDVTSSGTKTIKFNENQLGDTSVSELYLNPLSNCTIVVKGFVDSADNTGIVLKCVDIANLEKKSSVTAAGNYCYMVGSYYKVDVAVTGTSKILIKSLY